MPQIDNIEEVLENAAPRRENAGFSTHHRATASRKDVTGTLNTVIRFLEDVPEDMSVRELLEELIDYRSLRQHTE